MVFELVKNSLRAVQERFVDSDKVAPPVRIIVADGLEDVTIKVLFWYLRRGPRHTLKRARNNCVYDGLVGIRRGWWHTPKRPSSNFHLPLHHCKKPSGRTSRFGNSGLGDNGWIWLWSSNKPSICSLFWRGSTSDLHGRLW